jgi:hypothetical protein
MFELMRATNDELAAMPFATSRWPEAAISHLPDADRDRSAPATKGRLLKPGASSKSLNQEMQNASLDERIPVLRAQLDLGANHPLFDIFDRKALLRAVDDFAHLEDKQKRGVHGAINTAMWLKRRRGSIQPRRMNRKSPPRRLGPLLRAAHAGQAPVEGCLTCEFTGGPCKI